MWGSVNIDAGESAASEGLCVLEAGFLCLTSKHSKHLHNPRLVLADIMAP